VRVRPEQLGTRLERGLASVYVVHGDEPLQREESLDAVRSAARAAGFGGRVVLHAESGFDWRELRSHAANLSRVAGRRLSDLRVPGGSPGKDGGPALTEYASDPPPDMVLLLSCGRLDRRSTATKWFKALERAGDAIEVYPVRGPPPPPCSADRAPGRGRAGRVGDQNDPAAARHDLVHVRDRLVEEPVARRHHDDGHRLVDERDRSMLEFSACMTFSMYITDFFQFQCTFQRDRIHRPSAEIKDVPRKRHVLTGPFDRPFAVQALGHQLGNST